MQLFPCCANSIKCVSIHHENNNLQLACHKQACLYLRYSHECSVPTATNQITEVSRTNQHWANSMLQNDTCVSRLVLRSQFNALNLATDIPALHLYSPFAHEFYVQSNCGASLHLVHSQRATHIHTPVGQLIAHSAVSFCLSSPGRRVPPSCFFHTNLITEPQVSWYTSH